MIKIIKSCHGILSKKQTLYKNILILCSFILIQLLLTLDVFGKVFHAKIIDIDVGKGPQEEVLIFLSNGKVVKMKLDDLSLYYTNKLQDKKTWYQIDIDNNRYITDIFEIPRFSITSPSSFYRPSLNLNYTPTIVENMQAAKRYLRKARYYDKDSQCFNRAMVWSYEWWKKYQLKSQKVFIFFTRGHIRRFNFEWWFHVAPYVHVRNEDGRIVERVLDVKYTNGPREFQSWANIFLKNDAPCNVITRYSDYADYPYIGDCYFQKTHMYTYQPADLQMYEAWDYSKSYFMSQEVEAAYLEAFDEEVRISTSRTDDATDSEDNEDNDNSGSEEELETLLQKAVS